MKIVLINGLLFCLVFVWASAATQPEPESDVYKNGSRVGIQPRRKKCRNLGGWCIKKNRDCPKCLPLETETGRPYCSKSRRCCYPVDIESTTTGPNPGICSIASQRIVNGEKVQEKLKYYWQVGLRKGYVNGPPFVAKYFHCGGTIITKKHILTAAHCFYKCFKRPNGIEVCEKDIPVILYVGVGSNIDDQTTEYVMKDVAFPKDQQEYNWRTNINDIAIIELFNDIDFGRLGVGPICFARNPPVTYEGSSATVSGWGSTRGYPPGQVTPPTNHPTMLREAQITVLGVGNAYCTKEVFFNPYNMICAASTDDGAVRGPCHGDSGGPLTVKDNCPYVQIGIVSFSRGCATKGYPAFYTKVDNYLKSKWFVNFIGDDYNLCYV